MRVMSQITAILVLSVLSVGDIYFRKIPVYILIACNLAAMGYQIYIGREDVWLILGGIGVGILFFLISRVTREEIGYGDSWIILILGIYLGMWRLLEVLSTAFLLLSLTAVVCLSVKRMSRKYKLPFIPFLAAGYLCSIFMEGMFWK